MVSPALPPVPALREPGACASTPHASAWWSLKEKAANEAAGAEARAESCDCSGAGIGGLPPLPRSSACSAAPAAAAAAACAEVTARRSKWRVSVMASSQGRKAGGYA